MDFSSSTEEKKVDIIRCSRCGAEMKSDARYCMKCGNLNYSHPDNVSMRPYIKDVNSNKTLNNSVSGMMPKFIGNINLSNKMICLIVNILLHLVILFVTTYIFKNFLLFLGCFVLFIFDYSMQVVYIKANKKWWSYFIPFYNMYIFCQITLDNGWLFLLYFVPFVNLVVYFLSLYRLGIRFGRNGFFTLFFPIVFIPIIAFSKDTASLSVQNFSDEKGGIVDTKTKTKKEVNYRRKQFVLSLFVLVGFVILVYFSLPYIKEIYDNFLDYLNTKES